MRINPNSATVALPEIQIRFHGVPVSPAAKEHVLDEFEKLSRHCPAIKSAQVVIEATHRHHEGHPHFHVRLEIALPRGTVIVSHNPAVRHAFADAGAAHPAKSLELDARQKDIYVVINDAFQIARRQVEEHMRRFEPQPRSIRSGVDY